MKKTLLKEVKDSPYDLSFQQKLSSIPHLHNDVELVFAVNGSAVAHVDCKSETMTDGDLFISFPNQVHYYENATVGKYGVFIFAPETFFGKKEIIFDNIPKTNVIHIDRNDELYKLIEKLPDKDCGPYGDIVTAGFINIVFGELLNRIELKPRLKTDNSTLQNIINYCTINFDSELNLDDIANSLHLSKYYISYLLNNKLGISFNTYINTLRVNISCDMLADSDKKISEISEKSGFASIRSFNRAFTDIMGMSPSDYRKIRNNNT